MHRCCMFVRLHLDRYSRFSVKHQRNRFAHWLPCHKWIPFLLGNNETSPYNNCKGVCYSHSSYFAEVPEQYQKDKNGNIIVGKDNKPLKTKDWEDYTKKWGIPEKDADGKYKNHAIPQLVKPNNPKGENYEDNPF